MTTRVVFVAEAEEQLKRIDKWWVTHRGTSPDLFLDELDRAIDLLSELPDIGSPFRRTRRPGVRRLLLRRSKHWVFYVHDRRRSIVYILALWSTLRGSDPTLPKAVLS